MEILSKSLEVIYPTCGIGSLPYLLAKEAVNYSWQFDLPYLPQLPTIAVSNQWNENLLEQSIRGLSMQRQGMPPGLEFYCWQEMLTRLPALDKPLLKMQFAGAYCLDVYGKEPFAQEELINLLANRLLTYLQFFEAMGISLLIVLDEPHIDNAPHFATLYSKLFRKLPERWHRHIGLHCCGQFVWDESLDLPISIYSLDFSLQEQNLRFFAPKLLNQKVQIIIGAIPTDLKTFNDRHIEQLAQKIRTLPLDPGLLLISPACGHGLRSQMQAATGLAASNRLAATLRQSGSEH